MGRAEKRKEAKKIPNYRRKLTDDELLAKLARNGITPDDVQKEVNRARRIAFQQGAEYATQNYPMCLMYVMVATFDIVLHDECKFDTNQIKETNDAILKMLDDNKDRSLDELLEELHTKADLRLMFRDMTDELTDIAAMGDVPELPDIPDLNEV